MVQTAVTERQSGSSFSQNETWAVLPPPPPRLPAPSSCCAGLAARRGFLFWFLCWRSEFPGLWNQRRCCHVPPPHPPSSFLSPSQQSLWDGERAAHFIFREKRRAERRRQCTHAIPRARRFCMLSHMMISSEHKGRVVFMSRPNHHRSCDLEAKSHMTETSKT